MRIEVKPVSPLPVHLKTFITDCLNEIKPDESQCLFQIKDDSIDLPLPKRREVGSCFLTSREFQCVNMLIQKRFYQEVADELGLSKRTVEFYMNNIKKKYNLINKTALISYFKAHGLGKHESCF